MIALHLHPIHNAVGIRFQSLGLHGRYVLQAMTLENGRWVPVLSPDYVDRDLLEQPLEDAPITAGQFELRLRGQAWLIRHRGGNFGKCTDSAMATALEKARVKEIGRTDGRDSAKRSAAGGERTRIPVEAEDGEATVT